MENKREYGRWQEDECDRCNIPFQVTRTEPKTVIGELVCSDCELYERAFNDGVNSVDANELKAQGVEEIICILKKEEVNVRTHPHEMLGIMEARFIIEDYAKSLREGK